MRTVGVVSLDAVLFVAAAMCGESVIMWSDCNERYQQQESGPGCFNAQIGALKKCSLNPSFFLDVQVQVPQDCHSRTGQLPTGEQYVPEKTDSPVEYPSIDQKQAVNVSTVSSPKRQEPSHDQSPTHPGAVHRLVAASEKLPRGEVCNEVSQPRTTAHAKSLDQRELKVQRAYAI